MPNVNDMFPSKYLKASDVGDTDLALTIVAVDEETIGQGSDADIKSVVYFSETPKGMVLNKTNAKAIASLYGDESDDWAGNQIRLYATEVDFKGEQMLALRVRLRAPQPARQRTAGRSASTAVTGTGRFKDAGSFLTHVTAEFDLRPSEVQDILGIKGPGELRDLDDAYAQLKAHQAGTIDPDDVPFE